MLRCLDQQQRARESSDDAGDQQRNQQAPRHFHVARVGGHAAGQSRPQCNRVTGIGFDRRHSGEHHGWKRDEAAAARHRIERAGNHTGAEQDDGLLEVQTMQCITAGK